MTLLSKNMEDAQREFRAAFVKLHSNVWESNGEIVSIFNFGNKTLTCYWSYALGQYFARLNDGLVTKTIGLKSATMKDAQKESIGKI